MSASTEELNAGFDALHKELSTLVAEMVPAFFKATATSHLESAQGRAAILQGVKKVLAAAEAVRNKK